MNLHIDWGVLLQESPTGDGPYWKLLLTGLKWTTATALSGWLLALVIGAVAGVIRTAPIRALALLADAYVEVFRNIPFLVQLFFWFFVLPEILPAGAGRWMKQDMPYPEFLTAAVGLGLFTGARVAEQVKSGILSLSRGQKNAGLALGLTLPQTYRHVLLPMAFRIVIPPLTSEFMNTFKNSAVALAIGLTELTFQMKQMVEYSSQVIVTIFAVTVLYMFMALLVNRLMAWIERRARVPGMIAGGGK
ncbi:glutamate/aspartate transport system permease protein [Andreprevotia lacus DSM 23236]|uniref:Glutamate/aspartate transport system permease protein n=1 Tax=Andreprevotia lacus DSM 23236 TaxID=1121001 RepID=A0A1W1Y181_9NEIS|nr:amino acid ABC transporter permease [Andreprevotia lacus]SMC29561.1 glutamate/aspartate transport system permease protein [Andreprevotia lacus DSM 23236]